MASPQKKAGIQEFLRLAEHLPVIDVRSPSEYSHGHIPGAINIPLFDDREREAVGTMYRKEGRESAILLGLELTGTSMARKLEAAISASVDGKLLVHCWRGGMRSEAMAWLFSLGGIETEILEGGYKAYRNHVLEYLGRERTYMILGGLTGSGKTEILKKMQELNHQVIDLEGIACHKGSAFGSLGQPPQPTSEHFANILFSQLVKTDPGRPVWLEDESKNIGAVFMPDGFYYRMQESPLVVLMMDVKTRLPRLLEEYSVHSRNELLASVTRISRRLGGDGTRESVGSIKSGNFERAITITLNYYDKAYMYGIKKRPERNIRYVETLADDPSGNMKLVLEAAEYFRVKDL